MPYAENEEIFNRRGDGMYSGEQAVLPHNNATAPQIGGFKNRAIKPCLEDEQ